MTFFFIPRLSELVQGQPGPVEPTCRVCQTLLVLSATLLCKILKLIYFAKDVFLLKKEENMEAMDN